MRLSAKQDAVMRLLDGWDDGDLNEGNIVDETWGHGRAHITPRGARHVCNALERKGLLRFGSHWDEVGYELHLTEAGRAWLNENAVATGAEEPHGHEG